MDFSTLQSRVTTPSIPPHKTQLHPRMHTFSQFSTTSPLLPPKPSSQSRLCFLFASLFLIPSLFYLFFLAKGVHQSSVFQESRPKGFGIIINAGFSVSRIHVFEFLNEGRIPFVAFDGNEEEGSTSMVVRPGLAEFASSPDNAGRSIEKLVKFAKESVPKMEWKETKIWLMARKGMVEVEEEMDRILKSCRRVLRGSGFQFQDEWASAITGQEEGVYAWVAANYALGNLGSDPHETTGIIEIGGASVQVTFALSQPSPMELEFSKVVRLAGITYYLYAQSVLNIGLDMAWESLREHSRHSALSLNSSDGTMIDPCIPKGYDGTLDPMIAMNASDKKVIRSNSVGSFAACRSKASTYLRKANEECLHPPCKRLLPSLRGNPVPPENLLYISEFFGLVPKASLSELEAAGHHYCEDDWSKMKDEHHGINEMDLLRHCFSSAYIVALLNDTLGIPMDDKRIGFSNQSGGAPLDWTLGAFILQMVVEPVGSEPENLGTIFGNNLVHLLFAVIILLSLGAFYMSRLWKPQLKTVYDLEKGHYIITRVRR